MALRPPSTSSTPRLDMASRDDLPADSPPPGESSNGAKAEVGRKTKEGVDRLLAKLEKEGVVIDDKIASIIDDGIARIKAEAVRENIINELKTKLISVLDTIAWIVVGFTMGMKWYEHALLAANGIDKKHRP